MRRPTLLPFLFAAAFVAPLCLLLLYGRVSSERTAVRDDFPHAIVVSSDPAFLKIKNDESLNPEAGKDFLLFVWFKLRKLPEDGQKFILISKISEKNRAKPGFAIAVSAEQHSARFSVYWKEINGIGGWYNFADTPITPGIWTLAALTLSEERYLGMHTAQRTPEGKSLIQLAGGYELTEKIIPRNEGDLEIGAVRNSPLRGSLGPFGIAAGKNLSPEFKRIIKQLAQFPSKLPELPAENQLRLMSVSMQDDMSRFKHPIEAQGALVQRGKSPSRRQKE